MTERTANPEGAWDEQASGILDDPPTLSGLPVDAPEQLRATLAGDDPDHLPTDVAPESRGHQPPRPTSSGSPLA